MTINTKANVGDTIFAVYNDGFIRMIGPVTVSSITLEGSYSKEHQSTVVTYHASNLRSATFKCEESVVYTTLDSAVGRYTELAMKAMEPKQT